ncbi:GmrSD restriction endonuclease domain-containing protein [Agrobacterium tumefaciens]|uniref:GmrSD restriction endonuclease domain-containing protein n=1 Tax=Agrobacterium tumefaciens TaxID=358 RepID=UPI003BA17D6C
MSVTQLVQEIDNGDIVLPAIQRNFVWGEDQIEILLDSLFRGYPVGIALLWETYTPIQIRRFVKDHRGDIIHAFSDNPTGRRIRMVLDGQQRLNSLYVALKGTYNGKSLYFDVLSGMHSDDYSEQKYLFKFFTKQEAKFANEGKKTSASPSSHWILLSEILGSNPIEMVRLRTTIGESLEIGEEEKLRVEVNLTTAKYALSDNQELLKTQMIDANLPVESTQRKTVFDILEIFVRINRQGVPLKRSDLIVSMLRLYWPDASELIPNFLGELNAQSGLAFDNDFVIRCMFCVSGIGTRLDFDLLRDRKNIEKIRGSYERCFDAIRSARDFVRNECKIDNIRYLGGISTLVPVVYYIYHSPKRVVPLSAKTDLTRAIYLFAFSKIFSQHIESRTAAYIRDVLVSDDIQAGNAFPLKRTIQQIGWKTSFDAPDRSFFGNNRELALALLQNYAGGKVAFSGNIPEIDHIFPKGTLYSKGVDWSKVEDLANFWYLPRGINRNKSDRHPKDFLGPVDDALLDEALIDRSMLDFRKFQQFLNLRGAKMVSLLQKRTKLSESLFEAAHQEQIEE